MSKRIVMSGCLSLLLAGCTRAALPETSSAVGTVPVPAAASGTEAEIVPFADYHTHISSLAVSRYITDPILPEVPVPPEVTELLRKRMSLLLPDGDPDAVTDLYTDDAVLRGHDGNWVEGRFRIRATHWLSRMVQSGKPRIVPSRFEAAGPLAILTGTVISGGAIPRHGALVHMALRKERGVWRIAMESIPGGAPPIPVEHPVEPLIAEMNAAGVRKSILMSTAFLFGSAIEEPRLGEYAGVVAENDWVAQQAARYPDRLVAFCGFSPIRDYAVREIARCSKIAHVKGLKLHFSDSGVNLTNPEHLRRVKEVFRAANAHGLHVMAHISILEMVKDTLLGRRQAEIFLQEVLPLAPDVIVQIAHMGGDSGFPPSVETTFAVFADAVTAGDPRMKNVYFEVVHGNFNESTRERLVKRMRQVGMERLLFASDRSRAGSGNPPAAEAWRSFRRLPLTETEFRTIAQNVLPYVRDGA